MKLRAICRISLSALILVGCLSAHAVRADVRLERIATGLTSPTFVTQAPGDNNSLYVLQRNFTVLKYDLATRTSSTVLNLSGSRFTQTGDSGAVGLAFSPDFATDHLFYLSSNSGLSGQLGVDRVEEYSLTGPTATLNRTILQYSSNTNDNNHTVDWIGFDPTASGIARHYLYITTGDGGPQANIAGYQNRSQDLNQIYGKMLRVDVSGGDSYGADPNKNFLIPTDNPIPASGGAVTGLGEVFASGFRNPFRASFDRSNGDIYVGDVGFNTREEINFIKAGSITTTVPDFGWAKREGTIATPDAIAGISGVQGTSINPIIERDHTATGQHSITGGYVYRGPITSLQTVGNQVNYFFGDEVTGHIYSSTFDNSTDPSTFNGTNGVVTDLTTTLSKTTAPSSMIDPKVSTYIPGATGFGLQNLVSFGEDNQGNLLVVDFGQGISGRGEVFTLATIPGDINGDGHINAADIPAMMNVMADGTGTSMSLMTTDVNRDGVFNGEDLQSLEKLLEDWSWHN